MDYDIKVLEIFSSLLEELFLAITISRGDKCRGCYTSIDREFQGGLNDVSRAALKRKFEKPGVFFIFNNGFLAITISRDLENTCLLY